MVRGVGAVVSCILGLCGAELPQMETRLVEVDSRAAAIPNVVHEQPILHPAEPLPSGKRVIRDRENAISHQHRSLVRGLARRHTAGSSPSASRLFRAGNPQRPHSGLGHLHAGVLREIEAHTGIQPRSGKINATITPSPVEIARRIVGIRNRDRVFSISRKFMSLAGESVMWREACKKVRCSWFQGSCENPAWHSLIGPAGEGEAESEEAFQGVFIRQGRDYLSASSTSNSASEAK